MGKECAEPLGGGCLSRHWGQAHDAVDVGVTRKVVVFVLRPAVAEETGDCHLQGGGGADRVALEQPLRRVVGVRLWETVRVLLVGDLLPVGEIEGHLCDGVVCDVEGWADAAESSLEIGGLTECPDRREMIGIMWQHHCVALIS